MKILKVFFLSEKGQATTEYILVVAVLSLMAALVLTKLEDVVIDLWQALAKAISSPCPTCK